MPALNFQKRFAHLVASGEKRQTIRALRKRRFKEGDRLFLYTGMRTRSCRKLGEARAVKVHMVAISKGGMVKIDNERLSIIQVYDLAVADGFEDVADFFRFIETTHGLPFYGQLIKW